MLIWACFGSHGYLPAYFYGLREILGTDPDFVIVFQPIGHNVEVPLKIMASLVLQALPGKRGDSVVRCYLESLADPSPIGEEEVSLGVTAFADDAFEGSTVLGTTDELENDFEHVRLPTLSSL